MKTISTLLASFALTTSVFAAGNKATASLTVKSADKNAIVVVIDDTRYDVGSTAMMISDLDACGHNVIVYEAAVNGTVNCLGKSYDVLFNSSVQLKPKTNLQIAIDDCGVITMNETKSRTPKFGDTWAGEEVTNASFTSTGLYSKAISDNEFSRVVWAISKESVESNRMKSAEQIINTNYLTVDQVKQLLQLFSTDENKLALAKVAYDKTVDQSDYYTLNDLFRFDDSRSELARCTNK